MKYTREDCLEFIREEGVSFILLSFPDLRGRMRTTTIMPSEMKRAFDYGIAIDASAIDGFDIDGVHSDLFLTPDPDTLALLPWRPDQGKAVRFFCYLMFPDGSAVPQDSRRILKNAVTEAERRGFTFNFGTEYEFYLFRLNEDGVRTSEPVDRVGYMASFPFDKGEAVRREVCLLLDELSLHSEASHHEEGPGQNEIDFSFSTPLMAADNGLTFCQLVESVAERNGLYADFSPKPLQSMPGNGLHINVSVKGGDENALNYIIGGMISHIREMTLFFNSMASSYERLGKNKAPLFISYSRGNRNQLIRIPAASGPYVRAELRSPDASSNIYLALALVIYASLDGLERKTICPSADEENGGEKKSLPLTLEEARTEAGESAFLRTVLPPKVLEYWLKKNG